MHTSNQFALIGGDGAFADRQKRLFDQLSIAEKQCNKDKNNGADLPMEVESFTDDNGGVRPFRTGKKRKSETRQFRGKESIFKRPEGPAPRNNCRSIADHHRNPHKWVKYSLDDVSSDDMTDCSNARTAFAFLKELKARRAREESLENLDCPMECENKTNLVTSSSIQFKQPGRPVDIQFKKPETTDRFIQKNSVVVVEREEKPIFLSTKVVMPEYVVGQKQKRKDKEKKGTLGLKIDRTNALKLNHLEEFDEEDDQ